LNLDEQRRRYRALNDYFKTPRGQSLAEAFSIQLAQFKQHLNPGSLLQLGVCGDNQWLSDTAFKHIWCATPCLDAPEAALVTTPLHLPLQQHSVDVVMAPMVLELLGRNHTVLDEIDRVLRPMGHVVFFGINPLSLWGLSLLYHGVIGTGPMQPHSPWFLKRLFLSLGYQQHRFEMFYYVPPFIRAQWIRKSLFFNEMGKIMPIFPAGCYCLVMQKYQRASLGLLEPSTEAIGMT
jgi:hypothetical protein